MRIYTAINDHNNSVCRKNIELQFLHTILATSTRLQLAESAFQVTQTAQSNCLNLIVAIRYKKYTYDHVILPEKRNEIIH